MDWGFQQSEAQTVAARSYVWATRSATAATPTPVTRPARPTPACEYETLASASAAADTAGQVMMINGTSTVATTEYSSLLGRLLGSCDRQFPAVPDDGDARLRDRGLQPAPPLVGLHPGVDAVQAAYPRSAP